MSLKRVYNYPKASYSSKVVSNTKYPYGKNISGYKIYQRQICSNTCCLYVCCGRCRYGRKTTLFSNSHITCIKYKKICTKGPLERYTKSTTIWSKVLVLLFFVKLRSFCYAMYKVSRNWRSSDVKFAKKCGLVRKIVYKIAFLIFFRSAQFQHYEFLLRMGGKVRGKNDVDYFAKRLCRYLKLSIMAADPFWVLSHKIGVQSAKLSP